MPPNPLFHLLVTQRHFLRRSTTLIYLCWRSRVAFRQWKATGSPRSGQLYDERKKCKKNVRVYLSQCQAQLQRKVIQKRGEAFHSHHPNCSTMSSQKSGGTSLLINGSPNSDSSCVIPLWADHFSNLSTSRLSNNPSLQKIWNTIPEVEINQPSNPGR